MEDTYANYLKLKSQKKFEEADKMLRRLGPEAYNEIVSYPQNKAISDEGLRETGSMISGIKIAINPKSVPFDKIKGILSAAKKKETEKKNKEVTDYRKDRMS